MLTYVASASMSSGARARAVPSLCAPTSFSHYRRSTTNKAPRKRTFLLRVTKYRQPMRAIPASSPEAYVGHNIAMFPCGVCCDNYDLACGDDGYGNGNNSNNNGGRGKGSDGRNGDNGSGDNTTSGFGGIWRALDHAFRAALVLIASLVAFPAASSAAAAMSGGPAAGSNTSGSGARVSASFPSRPRSKVLHVPCKGSTLVVPLRDAPDDAAAQPRSRGPWSRARVVEAPIALSGREVALLDHRQYRVRESMRV